MEYEVNFRCYYTNGESNDHYRTIVLENIGKWIDAYKFTHPNCTSITFKIWFKEEQ